MNFKKLLVLAVAGAFALPFAAQVSAAGDNLILAQSSGGDAGAPPSGASSMGTSPATGGVASPRSAGEPKAPTASSRSSSAGASSKHSMGRGSADFSAMDKNGDGMISRSEWDAYHKSGAASGGATSAPAGAAAAPAARGKTGTTAGPGEAAPRTGAGSDTATSSSSSGTGKAQ